MAINDSNAPKHIPGSGEISPGNTNTDRSINLLKNIKTSTTRVQSNTSLNSLRNWFRTYIGGSGNFDNSGSSGTQVNLSDWHGAGILGVGVQTTNETQSTYGTNNDATVTLQGYFSEKFKYTFTVNNQSKTSFHGESVTFTGLEGGTADTPSLGYTCNVTALNISDRQALPTSSFYFTPGYTGVARVRGVNETGINSFGTATNLIDFTYTAAGGAAPGRTSDPLFLLIGKEDPGGRDYGPSFTYP